MPGEISATCRLLLPDNRVPLHVEKFVRSESTNILYVLAGHDYLADVVYERGLLHKEAIMSSEVEFFCDGVGAVCDRETV